MNDVAAKRPRFLIVALILSLALNLCIVGGASYVHWQGSHHFDRLGARLKLRQDQKSAFSDFRRALCNSKDALDEQDASAIRDAWDELVKDNPDPAKVQAAFDQMASHRQTFQVDITTASIHLMSILTPAQRSVLEHSVLDHRHGTVGIPLHYACK